LEILPPDVIEVFQMAAKPVLVRIARWSANHPWRALLSWLLVVGAFLSIPLFVDTVRATDAQLEVGESARATKMLSEAGLVEPSAENVLITSRGGPLDVAEGERVAGDLATRLATLPEVGGVGTPTVGRDRSAVLLTVTIAGDPDTASERVSPILAETARAQEAHPGLLVEQTGTASMSLGIDERLAADFQRAEFVNFPITLVILLFAFGALIAAGVPILLGMSAVGAALGLAAVVSHVFPHANAANTVILTTGMAVGIDYSLFYLNRARRERGRPDAVERAAETAGHTVMTSGVAVIVSLAGLYLVGDTVFDSLATGSIIVVAVAVSGALVALPAVLALLGPWIDRPRIPFLARRTSGDPSRLWGVLLRPALRRPALTLTLTMLLMVAVALPALDMKLRNTGADDLPQSIPAVQTHQRLVQSFPDRASTYVVVARANAADRQRVATALDSLRGDPRFSTAQLRTSTDGTTTAMRLTASMAKNSPEAEGVLAELRTHTLPTRLGGVGGVQYGVAGDVANGVDYTAHQGEKLPWVVGFVLLLTFLMMMVTFRSVVVALTTILLNGLSAATAFGVLVLVFQHHWAEGLLGFRSSGAIAAWVPLFLFVMLFGLSMDYHVFVVSRIREAVASGLPTKEAVAEGITRSAGVVTSAAAIMVSVFAVVATLSMIEMKQLGVGLAVAVLLDALVIRVLVLPALMALLGRANWWPGRVRPARTAGRTSHELGQQVLLHPMEHRLDA